MPASALPTVEHLTLANGLRVVLCHAPRLKRSAASLRVAAGSHDVPVAWPGLAHFLEHLFFLGTERFAGDQKLMPFVQRNGGQLNASTRERTTDFFFELPVAVFAQGLDRLCDMLVHPRMNREDQLREREVLHAEFIAWSRDPRTRDQIRLFEAITPGHPLKAFHAGNRYSLPVPRQAFQQALQDFYRRYYHAGQMTLCLTGPQSLAELKALATHYGGDFVAGMPVPQTAPPRLMERETFLQSAADSGRINLLFACENMPDATDEAVAFLCHHMNSIHPGGLITRWRERQRVQTIKAQAVYQFAGQLLIDIEVVVGDDIAIASTSLVVDWLGFFKANWPTARDDYNRLQQRRLETCGALDLANHYARGSVHGLSTQGGKALEALLEQLTAVSTSVVENIDWQLPPPNPFLTSRPDDDSHDGAVYLRWQLPSPQPALWQMFDHSLHRLRESARQAGVNLDFTAYGNYWTLRLMGRAGPMPLILGQALQRLARPNEETLSRYGQTGQEPALIPIRQLITSLADHYLSSVPDEPIQNPHVFWASTRWMTFTTDVSAPTRQALDTVLEHTPGARDKHPQQTSPLKSGKHWRSEPSSSSESAVLVFCPVPSFGVQDEAAWRMLAHLAQDPFYQRLRVELQLGYAVFSGFRQIAGKGGLLFGVQSPGASVAELVQHIADFIQRMPALIEAADLGTQRKTLAAQLDSADMESPNKAEMLWQAHLAGHGMDYLNQLHTAVISLKKTTLDTAAGQLEKAHAGWLILSNSCLLKK